MKRKSKSNTFEQATYLVGYDAVCSKCGKVGGAKSSGYVDGAFDAVELIANRHGVRCGGDTTVQSIYGKSPLKG